MRLRLLILFIAGAIHALGYPSKYIEGIYFAPLLAFIILFKQVSSQHSLKKKLLMTLVFCIGHNLCGYYWIGETLHIFGELPRIVSYTMSLVFSFFTMFHLWPIVGVFHYFQKRNWEFPLILALIATVLEFYWPQQFVTYLGQNFLLFAPYLKLAPIFGIHIFSLISYWIVFHINSAQVKSTRMNILLGSLFVVFMVLNIFSPLSKVSGDQQKQLKLRIVQASINSEDKVKSEQGDMNIYQQIVERYYQLSVKDAEEKPELIIWPETAYPYLLSLEAMKAAPKRTMPSNVLRSLEKTGAHLLTGGYDKNSKVRGQEYNSAFLFSPDPSINNVYHKRKLIPFGETLPFGPLNPYLKSFAENIAFFGEGEKWTQFEFSKAQNSFRFITPICYEILSPSFMREYLNEQPNTDFIVNLTNDSWYGDTSEPYQHLFLAKWRALEFQKPIVRTTNNGVTSVIYPDGSESDRLTFNQIDKLDTIMPLGEHQTTPYQKYGFLLTFILGLFLALAKNFRSVLARVSYRSL